MIWRKELRFLKVGKLATTTTKVKLPVKIRHTAKARKYQSKKLL
jgi:hypothetical protein